MAPIDNIASAVDNKLSTLESIAKMCEEIKTTPKSPYQQEMKTLFSILVSQVIEIKQDMLELKQDVVGIKEQLNSFNKVCEDAVVQAEKAKQYTRRNTVILSGLEMEDGETRAQLESKVSGILSESGIQVKTVDLDHCHRNGSTYKKIDNKSVPPSVTVVFSKSSKKDTVLLNYSNYDHRTRKRKNITIYQSLSKYYNKIRVDISNHISNNATRFGKCRWIHWRSATAGICVKTDKYTYTHIFCFNDFMNKIAVVN